MINQKFPATIMLSLIFTLTIQAAFPNTAANASRDVTGKDGRPPPASGGAVDLPPLGVMFQDDFEDGSASQWTPHGLGTWSVVYDGIEHGNVYEVNMGEGDWRLGWSTAGETNWSDYIVEFDIKGVAGAPNLLFGVRYADTQYSGYTFIPRTDLDWVYLVDDIDFDVCYPNCPILTTVRFDSSLETWYHIKIKVIGPRLQLFIDDYEVIDYTLKSPYRANGKIALTGWTGATMEHVVRFDNVVVYYIYSNYCPVIFNPN